MAYAGLSRDHIAIFYNTAVYIRSHVQLILHTRINSRRFVSQRSAGIEGA